MTTADTHATVSAIKKECVVVVVFESLSRSLSRSRSGRCRGGWRQDLSRLVVRGSSVGLRRLMAVGGGRRIELRETVTEDTGKLTIS